MYHTDKYSIDNNFIILILIADFELLLNENIIDLIS